MKRYRHITLSLLLLLLSLSTLSAQDENEPYPLYTENYEYTFFAIITPTYCQKDGLVRITLATSPEYFDPENFDPEHIPPYNPSEIKTVEYQLKDAEGNIYTTQSYKVTAPGDTVTIGQLEEGQYFLHVKITPKDGSKPPFEGDTSYSFYVQSRYQAITPIHDPSYEWIDKYRLKCRTDGTFWITVQASTYRPPVVKLVTTPSTYQGPLTIQPSSVEDYGYGSGLFSFRYEGKLPQGTYEYVLRNACEQTEPEKFVVHGPSTDLPTAVPADLSVLFGITNLSSRTGCGDKVVEFASIGTEGIYSLFETINKGYQGNPDVPFPEYVDSLQTIFNRNYEVLVITQKQQELLDQRRLDPNTLSWSSQEGSLTQLSLTSQEKGLPNIFYKVPGGLTFKELKTQKALPAALLIRVKQPNEGCDNYITIPIKISLDFENIAFSVANVVAESDCDAKQGVHFQGKNFCSVQFKYYILGAGEEKPVATATPVHISEPFGPAVGYSVDKYYSFAGYDPTKRYYVELVGTDLYGDPIPTASLVLPSSSGGTASSNRLYDSNELKVEMPYPLLDLDNKYVAAYLNTVSRMNLSTGSYSGKFGYPFAGMEITLVRAPEGYEDYQKTREDFYYRKPNPSNARNPYGGGMIRLGETVKVSSAFKSSSEHDLRLFGFLYKEENGQRVIYPFLYGSEKDAAPRKSPLPRNSEKEEYMKAHPMPRGIYRFKFEHPCQPGEAFYINVNTDVPDFTPKLTKQIEPVVDYSSCDEVRVYPFADGRLDYAVNEKGIPRNIAFTVTSMFVGDSKELYFYPYDAKGKPVDYTKFYIPIKRSQLPAKIKFEYKALKPEKITVSYRKKVTPTITVDSVGVCPYIEAELTGTTTDNSEGVKLPTANFNPSIYQSDWGESGFSSSLWRLLPYDKPVTVTVDASATNPEPSYIRRTYIGYRCKDRSSGYMEFKLVDIPNNSGLLILRERNAVNGVKQELQRQNIEDLTDMTVRWHLKAPSGTVLKDEYELVIRTVPCGQDPTKAKEIYFPVRLLDIADVLRATIAPSRGLCPGETVKLTGPNLGLADDNYVWTFYDFNGNAQTPVKGRTVTHQVSAPRVRPDKTIWYDTYTLTVSGLECENQSVTGILPVSPDELWWMPQSDKIVDQMSSVAPCENVNIDVELSATQTVATNQSQATLKRGSSGNGVSGPVSPLPNGPAGIKVDPGVLAARETYDWNNPDNWLFLHEGQFYRAQAVPASCTHVHIVSTLYQDEKNKRVWAPAPDLSPEVTLRNAFGEPTCADITFHSGAEVYDIPQLTYQRAMVRYNFGVNKSTSGRDIGTFGEGDYASDLRLYTSQENFASDVRLYMRDSLYLLAAPLYDIYAGDYSFSASPYTYQFGFKAVPAGNNTVATFDASAFNDPSPLQSISMAGNNNSIGLVVANDEQGFKSREGKSAIMERRGIMELPYFDRPDVAKPFYHHTYNAGRGESRFQYFDGKAKRFRSYYSYAQRSKMAYRFIFEDPNTQRIPKLSTGKEGYKLEVDFGTPAQEVMVGNPFMSTIDLDAFLKANKEVLQPYARQMRAKVASYQKGQSRLALTGKVTTFYSDASSVDGRYVAPLSAFVVKAKEGVGPKVELIFPKTIVPIGTQSQQKKPLRSATVAPTATTLRYLSLTLQSLRGKDRAFIAYDYESGSVDKMLLSSDGSYPSIAIIDPADGLHKDLYADDASTGHYKLATQVAEPLDVTLSLSGNALGNVTSARLIDHKSGLEHDLTGGKSCQIKLFPDDSEGRLELQVEGDFTAVAPAEKPSATLQAQYKQGRLTIRTSEPMSSVRLVQVDGVTLYWQQLPELTEYSEQLYLSTGSYIVETVSTEGTTRRVKLLVQ